MFVLDRRHAVERQVAAPRSSTSRLNYKVGDKVTYNLLRDGKRTSATLTLPRRPD